MDITSINALDRILAAKFEAQQRKSSTQEFTVVIEPALGAGARRHVIKAETRAEAELKAKQLAKDMAEQERIIQFVE